MVSQLYLMCGSTKKLLEISLGTRPRCNLVADEDVKKPKKQANCHNCRQNNSVKNIKGLGLVNLVVIT